MDILDTIVERTRELVAERRASASLEELRERNRPATRSLKARLPSAGPLIIAEFKRMSPSRPAINLEADPLVVAAAYETGGAAAMSVLTEPSFFGGQPEDLSGIRSAIGLPLLRKDFMIDPYQFHEARAMGADLVLLIARILTADQLAAFSSLAHELGMEVLCEIHHTGELQKLEGAEVDFLGVNCRDLTRFSTDLDHLVAVAKDLPQDLPLVAESGIAGPEDVRRLQRAGYRLFLVGEYLMKSGDPAQTLRELCR